MGPREAAQTADDPPTDGIQALNRSDTADVAIIDVGAGDHRRIHLAHIAAPARAGEISHPRAVISVGEDGHLELVETFHTLPGAGGSITNADTTVALGRGAVIDHVRVQHEDVESLHLGRTTVQQSTGSQLRSMTVLAGASIARHGVDVLLDGDDASADLRGLSVPSQTQHHDIEVTVDHARSRGTSTQRFMATADDQGRATFGGRVIVRADTLGNDARQLSRNLVLSPSARADARPWLEIFADDVSCTHGATVGQLDDEALFYLRSRGLPEELARSLLVDAFTAELLDTITTDSVREHVRGSLHPGTHRS